MKHSVPHDLGKEAAKRVATAAFDAYRAQYAKYNPTANWTSDSRADISFTAKGITLKGVLEVQPNSIDMDLDVPFLLRPFKAKAMSAIEGEITDWIGKAKRGEI
jgi:hypothetical protein